jgi:uncharacterized membrane protein
VNSTGKRVEEYLTALHTALKGLPVTERNEIVSEIGVHLRESLEQGADVESVISHLGPASQLAREYRENLWVQRATRTKSPWLMLRGAFSLARTSAFGFGCFVLAFIGYGTGSAMILSAILKPIFAKEIGLWIGPGVFNFGVHIGGRYGGGVGLILMTGSPAHEVLGWWYIPIALAIGCLFIWGTTTLVRKLVRRMRTRHLGQSLRKPDTSPIVCN